MISDMLSGRGRSRWSAPLVALATAGLIGCGGLLDVTNPNNVPSEATTQPVAAGPLVSGVWRDVSFGVANNVILEADASDEIEFSGSRDGWAELNRGKLSDGYNEFIDNSLGGGGYPKLAQARWEADNALNILEGQEAAGALVDSTNLVRAYLIAAVAYVTIPDLYDDFVISSNRDQAGPAVGEANMQGLYGTAIGYLNKALALPQAKSTLAVQLRMVRARAYFNKNVWALVHSPKRTGGGIVPNNADIASAVADAQAALAAAPSPSYKFEFTYSTATGTDWFGSEINSRQEMRLAPPYVAEVGSNKWGNTTLKDILDTTKVDPVVDAIQKKFVSDAQYVAVTVTSTREMHLILAEAALAGVATGKTVQQHINDLRALDATLASWDGVTPAPLAMLQYERQANLFLTGRRLADMYRFGLTTTQWEPTAQARSGGWFLPISAQECLSNPNIGAANCSR